MRLQPNRDYVSNDDIQTPPALARRIVRHFHPHGRVLEPGKGDGNFLRALRSVVPPRPSRAARRRWSARCEIKEGHDFFAWDEKVDWIVTNPPWSQMRAFLQHAMAVSDHVVFLLTINHLWTRARLRDIRAAGYGIREIVTVDTPAIFPPMGFQLGAVHLQRDWKGKVTLTDWTAARPGR